MISPKPPVRPTANAAHFISASVSTDSKDVGQSSNTELAPDSWEADEPVLAPAGSDPLAAVAPACGGIHDFCMIDASRAALFQKLGVSHGLFHGVESWPSLKNIKPMAAGTDLPDKKVWSLLVRSMAKKGTGFLVGHPTIRDWVFRVIPAAAQAGTYHILAFCYPQARRLLRPRSKWDPVQKAGTIDLVNYKPEQARCEVKKIAATLTLYKKAEQLLWFVHAEVLRQRCDRVVVPDVFLAEVLWGGNHKGWNPNWRQKLITILTSLTVLRWKTIADSAELADPVWISSSKQEIVSRVERTKAVAAGNAACSAACQFLHGRSHQHFLITVGDGFLGSLCGFISGKNEGGHRLFDFNPNLKDELDEAKDNFDAGYTEEAPPEKGVWKQKRREVEEEYSARFECIVTVPLPVMILGPIAGVLPDEQRTLRALVGEISRAPKKNQSDRPDHAHVIRGNLVPSNHRKRFIACLGLLPEGAYVAFNGNKRRWGMGYHVTTWMKKAGFPAPQDDRMALAKAVRRFFKVLEGLAKRFALIVVAYGHSGWLNLAEMRELAKTQGGVAELDKYCLRVYAPDDYAQRWRNCLAAGMPQPAKAVSSQPEESLDLAARLTKLGISHAQLGSHLKRTRQFVSSLLRAKKKWPADLLREAKDFVAQREQGVLFPP